MRVIRDASLGSKRVFVRADLDVPLGDEGAFEAATRLKNLKPTIDLLVDKGASRILIAGHIDRPQRPDPKLSTAQLLEPLEKILLRSIIFKPHIQLKRDPADVWDLAGPVVLMENLRFWPGEVANQMDFAEQLASLADVYVNEAFGNCHRRHASMVLLPQLIPSYAGLHLEQEARTLTKILDNPQRPFVAIVGGAKIETKVPVIENLAEIADFVLVGGELPLEIARTGQKFKPNVTIGKLQSGDKDISPESVENFKDAIKSAKTIIWNGPLGLYEEGFEEGTLQLAQAILKSSAYSVVGGGETTQFLANKSLLGAFSFVSAGGGAMLEFLAGKKLVAVSELQ